MTLPAMSVIPVVAGPALSAAPLPGEGCPPPLRCRDVWNNVHREATTWQRTSSRGATLSGWTLGQEGPTVVFIAPFGGSADLFALTAWLLRDEVRSVAVQWQSTGKTRSLTDFADDLWDAIDGDSAVPVSLFGINWSGAVAMEAARVRPAGVTTVFVQDGFVQRRLSVAERWLARAALWSNRRLADCPKRERVQMLNHRRWFPPLDPDRWQCFLETTGENSVSVLARQGLACREVDFRKTWTDWSTPTWLISTEGAGPRAHQHHAALQACLPRARTEWMHTTGSHACFTHPHRIAKFLRQALELTPPAVPAESCCGGTEDCETTEHTNGNP